MTARRIALALALVLTLAILASLFLLYKPMYPIRRGNATDFWRIAADVNRDGSFSGGWDGSAIPHGGGWIYTVVSSEYIDYYQVSDSEVNADGPRVVAALEKHANDPDPQQSLRRDLSCMEGSGRGSAGRWRYRVWRGAGSSCPCRSAFRSIGHSHTLRPLSNRASRSQCRPLLGSLCLRSAFSKCHGLVRLVALRSQPLSVSKTPACRRDTGALLLAVLVRILHPGG